MDRRKRWFARGWDSIQPDLIARLKDVAVPWNGVWGQTYWPNTYASRAGTPEDPGCGVEVNGTLQEHYEVREEYRNEVHPKKEGPVVTHGLSLHGGSSDHECRVRTGILLDCDEDQNGKGWTAARKLLDSLGFCYLGQQRTNGKFHIELPFAADLPLSTADKERWSAELAFFLGVLSRAVFVKEGLGFDPLTDRLLQLINLYTCRDATETPPVNIYASNEELALDWQALVKTIEFPQHLLEEDKRAFEQVCSDSPIGNEEANEEILKRARAYVAAMPASIEGQGGDLALFNASLALARGFSLPLEEGLPLLVEYNARAVPPWEHKDIVRKYKEASKVGNKSLPAGYLLKEHKLPRPRQITGEKITEDLFRAWATENGCTPEQFRKRLIISCDKTNWIWDGGCYKGPYQRANLGVLIPDLFAKYEGIAGIWTTKQTKNENTIDKKVDEILKEYSTVAQRSEISLIKQKSYYDAENQVFVEATAPLTTIEPKYHPEIDEWLHKLGGDKADKLLDWLATVHLVHKPTCILYLISAPSAGKGMLAQGLAGLWVASGLADCDDVLGAWNSRLATCPVVLVDEAFPENLSRNKSGIIRRFVGGTSFQLRRKFMDVVSIKGCPRMLITANNDRLLDSFEEFDRYDKDATAARLLVIKSEEVASDYLRKLNGWGEGDKGTSRWIDDGLVTAHLRWLQTTRKVVCGGRFLVEGGGHEAARKLVYGSKKHSDVAECVLRLIKDASPEIRKKDGWQIGTGWVRINATFLKDVWPTFMKHSDDYSTTAIGRALSTLSNKGPQKIKGAQGKKIDGYEITYESLLPILQQTHTLTEEDLLSRLQEPT